MIIGIYKDTKEVNEALLRYMVANDIYTHDIDAEVKEKDGAYIIDIKEE